MRAVRYERYGGPERLHLVELPSPVPGSGEVLVRVRAASVNSWDWDLLRGRPLFARLGGPLRPRMPVLGADVAGEVIAVGDGVTELAVGDRVHGDLSSAGWGGFAEFVAAPATAFRRIPDGIGFTDAAALPQAGGLALQGLRLAHVGPGDRVLVNGAGGGAGTLAVQLARRAGAAVTAVDRSDKLDLLTRLGATRAIDLADPAAGQPPPDGGYDAILELVARRRLRDYRSMLAPQGRFVIIGGRMGVILATFAFGRSMGRDGRSYRVLAAHANEGLEDLDAIVASGEVRPVIDAVLPLGGVPEALARIGAGDVHGKLVIDPTQ
ncbi:NADPH:quinone reductase-like Zn-dependent oxidoreductase [Agromyces ramosus]|uniref:NADPH:quinone reductase-like Zn-dependent oxidoreductase n=1 Tax=Agromyces ramosus TaxID=33879 RepID=A0A4Q7MHL8_9MICO|nr:NAD(P)-dependent alcohol dehydrogenase [Agromyces ramosus]RZS67694.1 NADPH:quinone reductase-like Zn-dependent oxidoreductase [Agromyces ramosus]